MQNDNNYSVKWHEWSYEFYDFFKRISPPFFPHVNSPVKRLGLIGVYSGFQGLIINISRLFPENSCCLLNASQSLMAAALWLHDISPISHE